MQAEEEALQVQVEDKEEVIGGETCQADAYHERPGLDLQHPEVTSARASGAAGSYPATLQSLMDVDGGTYSLIWSEASHYAAAVVAEENSKVDVVSLSEEVNDDDDDDDDDEA